MQKKDMELRTLNKRHAFGIKSDVYGCIHWLDEVTLAYPVGRNVVIHNVQTNSQKFFLTSEKTDAITAIALSSNKKFIAIAESGEHPQIQIIDTSTRKRRKVLNVTDLGSDRFVCLQFSADGRHLASQGGAPQWNLLYWNWERSKPIGQVQVVRDQTVTHTKDVSNANVVSHISINPRDPLHIVVSGNGLFRFYRYVDGLLKQIPGGLGKAQTQHFTTHSWVTEDRIIVATENADLLLIEDGEFRCPLPTAPSDNHSILSVVPTSRGFVCGGENGILNIFEQSDDKDIYRRVKTLSIESKDATSAIEEQSKKCVIRGLTLTQAEDMLAIATSTLQIYGLHFAVEWSKVSESPTFQSICQPFHSGPILGLDVCIRKPLVATSSADRTVRIWNSQDHTVEIVKAFNADPTSLALHPSGLHILICFPDKVRFMNLYGDNIQEFKAFNIRSVTDVKFSVGGQYFALVHVNIIHIFNTATCDTVPLAQLRGHSQRIRCLQWCSITQYPTDTRLVSCSLDGMAIDWNMKEMKKESDHTDKRFQYYAIASDEKNLWVVGGPNASQAEGSKWKVKLREIEVQNMHGDNVANDYEFPDLTMTSLVLAPQHRLLFGGCTDGSVKLMTFPLQGGIHDPPILAHAGPITRMAISFDESMLFTVGHDGSFYIFDIKEDGRSTKRETNYAEEILISKSDLEEKSSSAGSLRQTLEEMKTEMEAQEKKRNHEHATQIRNRTEEFQAEVANLASQFAAVWNAKVEQDRAFNEIKREKAEDHRRQCDALDKTQDAKRSALDEEIKRLKRQLDDDKERCIKELQKVDTDNEQLRLQEEEKFQAEISNLQGALHNLEATSARSKHTNRENLSQLEIDTDTEVETIRKKHEEELFKLREKYLHMKGEGAIMKKNAGSLQKEIDSRTAEVRALDAAKNKLQTQIRDLETRITGLHQEIDDRDLTIGEKEKRIYELKKRNQDLEKHKFVLDHRIRQLKSQIEPKQMEIARENDKIKLKDQELEQFHRNNLALRSSIDELKEKIFAQQNEIKTLLNQLKDFETYKSRVKRDIGELAQLVQDPDKLREGVDSVFNEHVVLRGGRRCPSLQPELKEEFAAQTTFLSKTVDSLKRKVSHDQNQHKSEISETMVENLGLIREIHDLRKENRAIRNSAPTDSAPATAAGGSATAQQPKEQQSAKELEGNRVEIQRLRSKIEDLEKQVAASRGRPASGARLTPM